MRKPDRVKNVETPEEAAPHQVEAGVVRDDARHGQAPEPVEARHVRQARPAAVHVDELAGGGVERLHAGAPSEGSRVSHGRASGLVACRRAPCVLAVPPTGTVACSP